MLERLGSFILLGVRTFFRQLWLSVSSIDFYKDVYKNYEGYGIRYLVVISFIPAIFLCVFALNSIENVKYAIKQLPEIQYDNTKNFLEESEPIYLYKKNKDIMIAIDVNNKLSLDEKNKIPIILTANKPIINLTIGNIKRRLTTDAEYFKIHESGQKVPTFEIIKNYCTDVLATLPSFSMLVIYLGIPLAVIVLFIASLLEKSFLILLIYILTNSFGPKSLMKTCIRLAIFASGIPVLLHPIFMLLFPAFGGIVIFIQMFTVALLFTALWQIKNQEIYG